MTRWIGIALLSSCLTALASPSPRAVGYGCSDAVVSIKSQELSQMGFQMGLEKSWGHPFADSVVVDSVTGGSPLGALQSARRLAKAGVAVLAGYPTSHEALLAARVAREEKIFAVFSGAGHPDLAAMGNTVVSTGESTPAVVSRTMRFIAKQFPKQRGLAIRNPLAVYSKTQADALSADLAQGLARGVTLDFVDLNKSLLLPKEWLEKIKKGAVGYLYFTTYVEDSARVLAQLQASGIDLPIVSSAAWTSSDVEFIRRYLKSKRSAVFSATAWTRGIAPEFERQVRSRYGIEASGTLAYAYDAGVVVGTLLKRLAGKPVTKAAVREAFLANPCFKHTTIGKLCFPKHGGHAERPLAIVRFGKRGFELVKGE